MGRFTCTSCGVAYEEFRFLHEELARTKAEREARCGVVLLKALRRLRLGLTEISVRSAILNGTADVECTAHECRNQKHALRIGPVAETGRPASGPEPGPGLSERRERLLRGLRLETD